MIFKYISFSVGVTAMFSGSAHSTPGFEYDDDDGYSCYMSTAPLTKDQLSALDPRTVALDLSETNLSDSDVKSLVERLTEMNILCQIKTLDLRRNSLTIDGLTQISMMRELTDLNIDFTYTQDLGRMDFFRPLTQLKRLQANSLGLRDEGIESLCRTLPQLETLSIEACHMTPASFPHLEKLNHLKKLSFTSDNIDENSLSLFLAWAASAGVEVNVYKVFS